MKRPYKLLNGKKPCPPAYCKAAGSAVTVRLQKRLTKGQQTGSLMQQRRYKEIFSPSDYRVIYLPGRSGGQIASGHVRSTQFSRIKENFS